MCHVVWSNTHLPRGARPAALRLLPMVGSVPGAARAGRGALLGSLAAEECVAPLLHLLRDHEDVREDTLSGIQDGAEAARGSPTFRAAIFRAVSQLARLDDRNVPECLIALDRQRAIAFLTGPKYLTPSAPTRPSFGEAGTSDAAFGSPALGAAISTRPTPPAESPGPRRSRCRCRRDQPRRPDSMIPATR